MTGGVATFIRASLSVVALLICIFVVFSFVMVVRGLTDFIDRDVSCLITWRHFSVGRPRCVILGHDFGTAPGRSGKRLRRSVFTGYAADFFDMFVFLDIYDVRGVEDGVGPARAVFALAARIIALI